jgi:serine/threonine protein kinase
MLRCQDRITFTIQVDISHASNENELLLLEREINLHAVVDHPHVIKLWDTLIEDNTVYMVMELA